MKQEAVNSPGITVTPEVSTPARSSAVRYSAKSSPAVAMSRGPPPRSASVHAMLPATPPRRRRMSSTRKLTVNRCIRSERKCSRNLPGNVMR